jgi:hypothetical protein
MPNTKEETKIKPLNSSNIGLASHVYQTFSATVEQGITKKDILTGEYWKLISGKLRHHDEIRLVAEDGSFYMRVLVTFIMGTDVRVKEIEYVKLEKVDEQDYNVESKYDVYHRGGNRGFAVRKKDTGENIIENCESKSAAHKQLEDYLKIMAA